MTGLRDSKRGQTGTRKEEFQKVRRGTHEGEKTARGKTVIKQK